MRRILKKTLLIISILLGIWLVLAQSCMTFRSPDAEAQKEFLKNGVTLRTDAIKVNGSNIHYAMTGNDSLPTLFFVHGTPGSWNAFKEYMQDPSLLKKFRMVSIDRPGFGYSDFGKVFNLATQSELISPLFEELKNGRPFYMAGHSLGGPMIVKLAADNPGRFSALVLISGSVDPAEEKPEKWRPVLYKTPLKYFIPGAMRPSNEELWYLKQDLVDLKADFEKINCAVYFIHGLKDTWVPPGNVAYAKKLFIHASHVNELMIPDANHFIPWTKYNEIRDILLKLE